jgi:hypothetical protein
LKPSIKDVGDFLTLPPTPLDLPCGQFLTSVRLEISMKLFKEKPFSLPQKLSGIKKFDLIIRDRHFWVEVEFHNPLIIDRKKGSKWRKSLLPTPYFRSFRMTLSIGFVITITIPQEMLKFLVTLI